MLILILAESALETVPDEIANHPVIRRYSKKRGKDPNLVILDRSYHHRAMLNLPNGFKRGRPDIVHFSLLSALGTPLVREKLMEVYVHTIANYVIYINPEVRIPRNYLRFIGLMEQLFQYGMVPPNSKNPLMRAARKNLRDLLYELNPNYTVAFTRRGIAQTLEDAMSRIMSRGKIAVLVGGFPHGGFSEETLRLVDETICIDPETLDAWTVVSRIIYEYERISNITKRRIKL
ncbi:MAG: 16S rRNA methyltransferase [Candidatus Methanomethylicia archaeon]